MPKDKKIVCPKCGSDKIEEHEIETPNAPYFEIIYNCIKCKNVFQDMSEN